jgi:hypothetical protein
MSDEKPALLPQHQQLIDGSAISPAVAAQRISLRQSRDSDAHVAARSPHSSNSLEDRNAR